MIKKILILIFFIISSTSPLLSYVTLTSTSPLLSCDVKKIKNSCSEITSKLLEEDWYQTTAGMSTAYGKEAACIVKAMSIKFDKHYTGEPEHHDPWNPNVYIDPEKSREMFTKLLNTYYETYIEMEQAKGGGTIMYIDASIDMVLFAYKLLDQMYEVDGCPVADVRNHRPR